MRKDKEAERAYKREYYKRYYAKNKEKYQEYGRRWRMNNPEKVEKKNRQHFIARRLKNTGFTVEMYEKTLLQQKGLCAICGIDLTIVQANADHDHESGKPRGVLCSRCNVMLGMAKEETTVLLAGVDYIMKWREE